ncbi:MAG: hypothetical protein BGO43_00570 [Gammaproteobacteria bacterium 39-13]|nr:hypothetical protein [Gammaproteobacteria bacterium]OJV96751.1 MAG: hypothetical protein BGO43_00570 [Gammaproteobacteria bacterium 39-13]
MVSDKNSEYKFTGGNSLTGIHKLYHEVMMLNELWNGYGAYEVSYAAGKSGISFGGNQMDMHDNKKTAEKFTNILISATDNAGKHFFTQGEVKMIVGNEFVNLIQNGEVVLSMLGDNLASINAALSSVYGRARIDQLYVSEIKNGAEHIEKVIEKITNAAAKKFYDSDLGRVLLFDYHNQYDLKFDGRFLADYINGKGKENFSTKEMVVAPRDHSKYRAIC